MKLADFVWIWAVLAMLGFVPGLPAEDWPQWRYDACHSAESPENLPSDLHLQWSRQFAPRVQTWDDPLNNDLISFDRILEPIVLSLPPSFSSSLRSLRSLRLNQSGYARPSLRRPAPSSSA